MGSHLHVHTHAWESTDDVITVFTYVCLTATRVLVLEGLPDDVTQEQIAEFFPEARTSVVLTNHHTDTCGYVHVDYARHVVTSLH